MGAFLLYRKLLLTLKADVLKCLEQIKKKGPSQIRSYFGGNEMKVLEKNGQVIEGNFDNKEVKEAFWHTSAHVLAQAVKRLYPDTKCAIGPAIDNGFYYDFDFSFPFTEENLAAIEKEMKKIVKQSLPLEVFEVKKEEALSYMKERQEDYKVEMIEELPEDETITFYKQGDYEEFCAGPHVSNTCVIKAIKLLSTAGAYWRGD